MIKGFKEFILRGNVIDLAVAVVIGAAFSAIVTVVVAKLINPLIGLVFKAESLDKAMIVTIGSSHFGFGAILGAIINFVAVAAVVYFVFVMPMNHFKQRQAAKAGVSDEPEALPTEQELLIQIRDLLEKQNSR
ncbi:large conductance mechanosensitive channel protein MscL [Microbacterium sp. ASV81]|uniref:Large-conductance mechanosensitive channel n=1 Tax=Microbacterium capsulatum TaxID=3041921 RepID=A0ABU0XFC6_9MICO|nr:large conductance mechanosensitive channel protein MscL [Microbacterium sp. ASV81]MDQ4213805.1 large conductance mechanosensitive channel protein MscL [Microbacterium sp. ASV81]